MYRQRLGQRATSCMALVGGGGGSECCRCSRLDLNLCKPPQCALVDLAIGRLRKLAESHIPCRYGVIRLDLSGCDFDLRRRDTSGSIEAPKLLANEQGCGDLDRRASLGRPRQISKMYSRNWSRAAHLHCSRNAIQLNSEALTRSWHQYSRQQSEDI